MKNVLSKCKIQERWITTARMQLCHQFELCLMNREYRGSFFQNLQLWESFFKQIDRVLSHILCFTRIVRAACTKALRWYVSKPSCQDNCKLEMVGKAAWKQLVRKQLFTANGWTTAALNNVRAYTWFVNEESGDTRNKKIENSKLLLEKMNIDTCTRATGCENAWLNLQD